MKTSGYITLNKEWAKLLPNKTMMRVAIKKVKIIKTTEKSGSLNGKIYRDDKNNLYFTHNLVEQYSKHQVGDILWVREPVKINTITYNDTVILEYSNGQISKQINIRKEHLKNPPNWYEVDKNIPNGCLKEMARYFIKITSIKVERLQDITDFDIQLEGIRNPIPNMLSEYSRKQQRKSIYKNLWNSIAPKGYKWEDNPYVFVYKWEYIK